MDINNISYKESISDLDEINEKAKIIKEKIEKEIKNIEISKIKVFDEITSSFEKKRLELDEEEKLLKAELDTKCKEIKNELQNSLKESISILSNFEKIIKKAKTFEEKIKINELIKFYYISEINKKAEKMKNILGKPIKNIDINFDNISKKISYRDYYFSGNPIPKDIKYEIKENQLLLSWNINELRIKEPYNFVVQIKVNNKENIYKVLFPKFILDKYETNAQYEVKIRTSIDGSFGDWSDIKKFKIDDFKDGDFGNNNNIILSSSLYNLQIDDKNNNVLSFALCNSKKDDNDNKKNNNIFSNLNQEGSFFSVLNSKENDKQSSLFNFNMGKNVDSVKNKNKENKYPRMFSYEKSFFKLNFFGKNMKGAIIDFNNNEICFSCNDDEE